MCVCVCVWEVSGEAGVFIRRTDEDRGVCNHDASGVVDR